MVAHTRRALLPSVKFSAIDYFSNSIVLNIFGGFFSELDVLMQPLPPPLPKKMNCIMGFAKIANCRNLHVNFGNIGVVQLLW